MEVNLARQIAAYAFGSADKVELTCVTAANRIPSLQGGKIDLIIATLGVSAERAQVIDFSDNYAWGGSDVLIAKDSPIKSLKELAGKTVIVMKGAWQIGWFEKNVPTAKLLKLDGVSDGLQALLQKRADAFAHDLAVLRPIAIEERPGQAPRRDLPAGLPRGRHPQGRDRVGRIRQRGDRQGQ